MKLSLKKTEVVILRDGTIHGVARDEDAANKLIAVLRELYPESTWEKGEGE